MGGLHPQCVAYPFPKTDEEVSLVGKSLHQADALRAHRGRINADIIAVLRRARDIHARLESLDRANAAQWKLSTGCREGTPLDRTRTAVTVGLRKKLKDLMLNFQALRQRMMSEYSETVERRYYTLTGKVPEEEVIERIISDGRGEELLGAARRGARRGRRARRGARDLGPPRRGA